MIWALGHAQRVPDKQWADEFLKVTFHKMGEFNGQVRSLPMGGW